MRNGAYDQEIDGDVAQFGLLLKLIVKFLRQADGRCNSLLTAGTSRHVSKIGRGRAEVVDGADRWSQRRAVSSNADS